MSRHGRHRNGDCGGKGEPEGQNTKFFYHHPGDSMPLPPCRLGHNHHIMLQYPAQAALENNSAYW
jgi:hypothetical protein